MFTLNKKNESNDNTELTSTPEVNNNDTTNLFKRISDGMGVVVKEQLEKFTSKEEFASFTDTTKSTIETIITDNKKAISETEEKLLLEIKKMKESALHLDDMICDEVINSFKEILNTK